MIKLRETEDFPTGITPTYWLPGDLSGFTIYALNERGKAVDQKMIAEDQKNEAIKANEEAEEAKQRAEETFSWNVVIKQIDELYESLKS